MVVCGLARTTRRKSLTRAKPLSRKAALGVVRGLQGLSTRSYPGTMAMNNRSLHRQRLRSAYLHLFVLLILLPAFLPLPLLITLGK
jgi:hypothetical protein